MVRLTACCIVFLSFAISCSTQAQTASTPGANQQKSQSAIPRGDGRLYGPPVKPIDASRTAAVAETAQQIDIA